MQPDKKKKGNPKEHTKQQVNSTPVWLPYIGSGCSARSKQE
jgi:hypothetical protein